MIDDHGDRSDGDVSHRSELAAVVQMLILQAEVVPDESTKDLDQTKDETDDVGVLRGPGAEVHEDIDQPNVPKEEIFDDGQVVVEPRGVDNLIAKEFILAGVLVEEAPVHLQVPEKFVRGPDERGDDPQVQERIGRGIVEIVNGRRSTHGVRADDEEATGVFAGVGQVRELLFRVAVTAETLGETEPGR